MKNLCSDCKIICQHRTDGISVITDECSKYPKNKIIREKIISKTDEYQMRLQL